MPKRNRRMNENLLEMIEPIRETFGVDVIFETTALRSNIYGYQADADTSFLGSLLASLAVLATYSPHNFARDFLTFNEQVLGLAMQYRRNHRVLRDSSKVNGREVSALLELISPRQAAILAEWHRLCREVALPLQNCEEYEVEQIQAIGTWLSEMAAARSSEIRRPGPKA
jgi:hypothetical protein